MTTHTFTLCILAPVVVMGLACGGGPHTPEAVPVWRFDCPTETVDIVKVIPTQSGKDSTLEEIHDIPLSEPVTNIPEYHDCQRFLTGTDSFGATYAVFVAFRLNGVLPGLPGANAHVPVATIYTPDGVYDYLGIKPGFNCLFLMNGGGHWAATIVARGQGSANKDCAAAGINPTGPNSKSLRVIPNDYGGGFAPEDFPPAARWDWDSLHKKQYVGVRCGRAWCEVGDSDLVPSPGYGGGLQFPTLQNMTKPRWATRVQTIKGWYDWQELSVLQGGTTVPSHIRGFLIPAPALDSINWLAWHEKPDLSLKYYRGRWVHVAYAVLDGNYPKWNFKLGVNKISLCYGTTTDCPIPHPPPPLEASFATPLSSCPPDPTHDTLRWWARTESDVNADGSRKPSTKVTYACIKRMDHHSDLQGWEASNPNVSYSIPGAARWSYHPNDEQTWTSCPTGCCTKQ